MNMPSVDVESRHAEIPSRGAEMPRPEGYGSLYECLGIW